MNTDEIYFEHHNPNKETQEAMQEVLDKDANEFEGIWVSKENNPDWEIEYHSDCGVYLWAKIIKKPDMALGHTVGQLFTISKSALREGYSKKYVGDVDSEVEYEQIEKELTLVEKYPHYYKDCLLYTSPSPRDRQKSRMPSSA